MAMNKHEVWLWLFVLVLSVLAAAAEVVVASRTEQEAVGDERDDLLVLRDTLRSARSLHSNWTGPPCHEGRSRWYGVECDGGGRVVGIALDGIELTGALPRGALRNVTRLATLSLRDNALHGALPGLDGLARLRAVYLSRNRFSGPIPRGYATALRALERLELQDNLLNGTLPAFDQPGLAVFNVSYNFLQGEVPDTPALRRFPESAFDHNIRLCGAAVNTVCRSSSPSGSPTTSSTGNPLSRPTENGGQAARKPGHLRTATWTLVVLAVAAALASFMAVLFLLYCTKKRPREIKLGGRTADIKDKAEQGRGSGSRSTDGDRSVELQFFGGGKAAFDVDELFRSTAEMLGKGRLGITYRVTLEAGPVVVVKRLRNMGHVTRKEFAHCMQLLGRLRHEHVVAVLSCYFSSEDKLVIYEHVPGCSLFHLLHENRGEGRTPLPWPARLSIAKGMARGLAYLHQTLPFHRPPHGDLKSSNVLVLPAGKHGGYIARLTDHGFAPLLPHHAHRLAASKCPEFARGKRLSHRADVFCLGLVLLELVTGKVPVEEDGDLAEWARLALSHEWSTDILDVEIVGERERHGDMLRLTEVALLCSAIEPDRRPKAADVVKMIDDIAGPGAGDGTREL